MKFLLSMIIIILSTAVFAENSTSITPGTSIAESEKPVVNLKEINNLTDNILDYIIKFQKMLPEVTGKIISLPKAGTVGIEFDKDKFSIHEGLKLIAKRKGIDKPLVGDGIIYLKYNKYHKLVGKYTRSQVGKFDIADRVNSKWYKPVFVIGSITDNSNTNTEVLSILRKNLIKNIKNNKNIKTKTNKKIELVLNKISTLSSYQKEMKKLFGYGIDYVLSGNLIKKGENEFLKISVISTYTGKSIFDIKIDTNL